MATRGQLFAGRVERILARAGESFGSGKLQATLVRTASSGTGQPWNPADRTSVRSTHTVIWGAFSQEERASGLIQDGDAKLLLSSGTLTPRAGDRVEISGETWRVKSVQVVRPGGDVLMSEVVVRQ